MKLYWTWFKMGLFTFGGGYAMLPLIQKEVVEKQKWATEEEILTYYTMGQFLPGIIAVNTATLVGYKQDKVQGALVATAGVISPSILLITLFSFRIKQLTIESWMVHALAGVQVGVGVLLVSTIIKMWKANIRYLFQVVLFCINLVLIVFMKIPLFFILAFSLVSGEIYYVIQTLRGGKKL